MKPARASLCAAALLAALVPRASAGNDPATALQAMRRSGDLAAQRRHVWNVVAGFTAGTAFESWHGEDAIFGTAHDARGITGFARTAALTGAEHADVPVITYTLYNDAAFDHIRRYKLDHADTLERLRKTGEPDSIAGNRTVPAFPAASVVLKTAWWPIAHDGLTAMPVWDSEAEAPAKTGNPYIAWRRVVAVDPSPTPSSIDTVVTDFAGRSFAAAHRVSLSAFHHVRVDAPLATRLMRDPESAKAVMIGLGRPLRDGDYLALVAMNLATREVPDWIWAALWWHDDPAHGAYAADRPATIRGVWTNYRMQAAFDAQTPRNTDGTAHVAFNPWLEGRFPDGGQGGGAVSNCLACHARASYPATSFLPVTRGAADTTHDRAFAPGQLRTSFLWSLALHAKH